MRRPSEADPRLLSAPAPRLAALAALVPVVLALDHAALAAVLERLRADLWLTDLQLGLVGALSAVAIPVGLWIAPSLARPAGVGARVGAGLLLLAAGALSSSAALGELTLLSARAVAGVGAGLALDAALVRAPSEARRRARHLTAKLVPVAAAAGYAFAGVLGARFGWRAGIAAIGFAALVAAAVAPRLGTPGVARAPGDAPLDAHRVRLAAARPGWRRLATAMTLGLSAAGGVAFWGPAFLERVRGVPRGIASVELGAIVLMAAFGGVAAGAGATAALRRRFRGTEAWVAAGATLGAAPIALALVYASPPFGYLAALVVTLLLLAAAAPAAVAALSAAAPREGGGDAPVGLLAIALAGMASGALVVGGLAHATSLWWAMLAIPAAALASGLVFAWAARGAGRAPHAADVEPNVD